MFVATFIFFQNALLHQLLLVAKISLMKNLLLKRRVTLISSKKRHYLLKMRDFEWLVYDEDLQGAFCKHCQKWAKANNKTGGTWVTKVFHNWKKAVAKIV